MSETPGDHAVQIARLAGEIAALRAEVEAGQKAVEVFSENLNRVPTAVDKAVGGLQSVMDERFQTQQERFHTIEVRFEGIRDQLAERAVRVREQQQANQTALATALSAQSEAAAKSERNIQEKINEQRVLNQTNTDALRTQVDDLKQYRSQVEGRGTGTHQLWAGLVAGASLLIAVLAIVVSVLR